MDKAYYRAHTKRILLQISVSDCMERSRLIASNLYTLDVWIESGSVLIFLPLKCEVDTYPIIDEACRMGKLVAVPRVEGKNLVFHDCIQAESFIESSYGIREPAPGEPLLPPAELDMPIIVITPGLAFDRQKHRLGRGGGFYDRFLKSLRSNEKIIFHPVAICFAEQLYDAIPSSEHDEKVECIVTDREIIR